MKLFDLMRENRDLFSDDFVFWLPENMHIFQAFAIEATKIHSRGFKHYSARTIIHVFDLAYPHMAGMFEYRTAFSAERDAMKRWGEQNAA